ncbi:MAG TPA: hypothetical protein VGM34_01790 [Chlamydiales bacterium]|jgi:hypothetical protein
MLELTSAKRHKISLADYNSRQDIENRMLMADFSPFDIEILEEILFSSLKIFPKKIARAKDVSEEDLKPIFQKLSKAGLLSWDGDFFLVDKEMRKYFEFEVQRFEPSFKPDMEFLQGLLKKVPIHLLPTWYSIPRSSGNIFESIIEKHLLSPNIFQRYLQDLHFTDPLVLSVLQSIFAAPDFRASSSDLIAKYNLSRPAFEEIMLLLEFSFVCCVSYVKEDDHWHEVVTPFNEWHEYLLFLQNSDAPSIDAKQVQRKEKTDFAFIKQLETHLLSLSKKSLKGPMTEKLCMVKLAQEIEGRFQLTEVASEWLPMSLEDKALYFYRHPHNRLLSLPPAIATERNVRETEKSIKRVLHGNWILFEDFVKGVLVPLSEESVVVLKKTGKHWKYTLPVYSEEEQALIKAVIFEWLFECGMVAIGTYQGKDCFSVTPFGRFFFQE